MNTVRFLMVFALFVSAPTLGSAQNKPVVAIIGTGDLGNSLGPVLAVAGYPVVYGSRDPERKSVQELVELTGHNASAATQRGAAERAEIVVLAVPWPAMEQVVRTLGDLAGKILMDVSQPTRQANDGHMESSVATSGGEIIQGWRPEARVVKVSIPSSYLVDDPTLLGMRPTVMIASDDRAAKETVGQLLADIGLDPWDAGPLRFSRSIEAFGLLFWVPLLQGREEGIELKLMRSSFWPCVWDLTEDFEVPADRADLAEIPSLELPRPCDSYFGDPVTDTIG